jgi:putative NIF3 family GTP cyclohydrolase 1 type 2
VIIPAWLERDVIAALKNAHPYEEAAYDLVPLQNEHQEVGAGMIGTLENELEEKDFLQEIKYRMKADCIRHSPLLNKKIKKVAVCGGSGSFLLKKAIEQGADVFVTADYKYHQFFEAEGKILIADVGHYESEQFTIDLLYDVIRKEFPDLSLLKTVINTNPVSYF